MGRLDDGHRVYFVLPKAPFGSMSEQTVVPLSQCVALPDGLDDVTAAATPDARVLETIAWAVVLTAFCCVLFLSPYLLGLPIPLWPISNDPLVLIRSISFQ